MTKTLGIALVAGAIALAGPGASMAGPGAGGKSYHLSARMNTHQVVTPLNKPLKTPPALAAAAGVFTGTLTVSGNKTKLTWQLTYNGLGKRHLDIVDIHLGKPGKFGQILVRLCVQCKSGQKGSAVLSPLAAQAIRADDAWVTIITDTYPNGLIRGQIQVRAG